MHLPPPLFELAVAELHIAARDRQPGHYATVWGQFGTGLSRAVACAEPGTAPSPAARAVIARPVAPGRKSRKGRKPATKARQRRKIKQHNGRLAQRDDEDTGIQQRSPVGILSPFSRE
jgi:hypothetical protein